MKNVLIISESLAGGLRKHIVQLINSLDKDKYKITLIYGNSNVDDGFIKEKKKLSEIAKLIECEMFVRNLSFKDDMKTLMFLIKKINEINPDIVHCHSSKAGALGRIAAKICGVNNVFYTPHAYSFLAPEFSEKKKKFFVVIEKILSKFFTTKTFCVSKGEYDSAVLKNIDKKNKFKVIYNGLPMVTYEKKDKIRKKLGIPLDAIVIGNSARMSEQKNPLLFVEIARNIIKINPNFYFVWCGNGPLMNQVEIFVKKYDLENNFKLLGDRSDSEYIVSSYDYFLIVSLYEGLPYAPIEAIRAGVPVIGTDVIGVNEVVFSDKIGRLFPINITDYQLLNEYFEQKYFKNEIQNLFKSRFSIEKMINSIDNEYQKGHGK